MNFIKIFVGNFFPAVVFNHEFSHFFSKNFTRAAVGKKLVDFLKTEGDNVSVVLEKPSEILKKIIIRLNFENRAMGVMLEDNDAILVDLDLKIKIHHYVGATLPFSIKRSDYFEERKP